MQVRYSDSEESEEECNSLPVAPQKTTMLSFFKRVSNGKSNDFASEHQPSQVTNSTKASVKQTTADKKRKKDEVVTNGSSHSRRASNKSPPPKKRIEDNCEKDEVSSTALKNASCSAASATSRTEVAVATAGANASNSSTGISSFFRPITKKEFFAENEKESSLTVVKGNFLLFTK